MPRRKDDASQPHKVELLTALGVAEEHREAIAKQLRLYQVIAISDALAELVKSAVKKSGEEILEHGKRLGYRRAMNSKPSAN